MILCVGSDIPKVTPLGSIPALSPHKIAFQERERDPLSCRERDGGKKQALSGVSMALEAV